FIGLAVARVQVESAAICRQRGLVVAKVPLTEADVVPGLEQGCILIDGSIELIQGSRIRLLSLSQGFRFLVLLVCLGGVVLVVFGFAHIAHAGVVGVHGLVVR